MSVNYFLSLCVSFALYWRPIQGAPFLSPYGSSDMLQSNHNPDKGKWKRMDGCVDVWIFIHLTTDCTWESKITELLFFPWFYLGQVGNLLDDH